MSTSVPQTHRNQAPRSVRCAVVTISDTRSLETDRGGAKLVEGLQQAGHEVVAREMVPDEPEPIRAVIDRLRTTVAAEAILLTGGTGLSSRDQTFETLTGLFTKVLPGYGELFRWLSYQEIGPAAMLSRAVGGLIETTVVLSMPGSPAAVQLALHQVILPELGHLVHQAHS